jgi:hypothetical protein
LIIKIKNPHPYEWGPKKYKGVAMCFQAIQGNSIAQVKLDFTNFLKEIEALDMRIKNARFDGAPFRER